MKPSDLKDNVSSDLIAGQNAMQPKTAPKRIYVFVESDEDISFWRNILHEYESETLEFEITTPTKKGKQKAIEKSSEILDLKVGQFLIVCVDSDYDYLLPDYSPQSKKVNYNPYIFQTYSYSIENLQCFSESLHAVCVQSTKHDKRVINFRELLKTFSEIVYPLFLWNLFFRKKNDHETFTISDFCETVKLTGKLDITDQCAKAFESLRTRVGDKVSSLEKEYPLATNEIKTMAASMQAMGVNADNTYLFVHGHTLKDNVVLMVLKPVCQLLVTKKYEHIKNNAQHKTQEENDRNYYKSQKQDIEAVLSSNTEFKNCFLFRKIKADFDKYIKTLN